MPNMTEVYKEVKADPNISISQCCPNTFFKILRSLGYKMVNSKKLARSLLMEKPEIIFNRRNYLRHKKHLMTVYPQSEIFYLDETYVHKNLGEFK